MHLFSILLLALIGGLIWIPQPARAAGEPVDLLLGKAICVKPSGEVRADNNGVPTECYVDDEIRFHAQNLKEWLKHKDTKLDHLVLSADGHRLASLKGRRISFECDESLVPCAEGIDPSAATPEFLAFLLRHSSSSPKNQNNLEQVLARFNFGKDKTVVFSVVNSKTDVLYGPNEMVLEVASSYRLITVLVLYAALLLVAYYGVGNWGFLRDPGPKLEASKKRPFSLGACQMAWWFFLILGGFLYLWMVTGRTDTLSEGVLVLAGISAATGISAVAVGANKARTIAAKREPIKQKLSEIELELDNIEIDLTAALKELAEATPNSPDHTGAQTEVERLTSKKTDITAEHEKHKAELSKHPLPKEVETRGFMVDVLANEGEVTFSRFQILAWTAVLGLVFVHSVYSTLAMPKFDPILLGLMGLSAGTYVGFKFPAAPKE